MKPLASDQIDSLVVEVLASTQGFTQELKKVRGLVDADLVGGFVRAGDVLERGLLGAIRKGSLGFDDLKRVALSALDDIASQALDSLFNIGGGGKGGGLLGGLGGIVGSILGLPGRATGGNVSPGRGFLVGERGPELFVPTSAGRVEANVPGGSREVRVSINVTTPHGSNAPQALQRSTRQVASAVRRALTAS